MYWELGTAVWTKEATVGDAPPTRNRLRMQLAHLISKSRGLKPTVAQSSNSSRHTQCAVFRSRLAFDSLIHCQESHARVRMYSQTSSSRKPPPSLLGTTILMPKPKDARDHEIRNRLFKLLLGAELVGVSALALSAVGGTGREAGLTSHVSIATRT